MGKSLIIKGADFSAVAVGQVTPPTVGGKWLRGYSDETLTEGNKVSLENGNDWAFITSEDASKVFTKIKFYAKETGDIILGGKTYTVDSLGINIIDLSPSIEGKDFTIRVNKRSSIIGINNQSIGFKIKEVNYYFPIDIYYE